MIQDLQPEVIMSLRGLSDETLDQNLMSFVRKEKAALKEILLHIAEVDRRRLYLKMAYSSLRDYLTQRMGYDGGGAQRRLDAARLSLEVPSVIESLDRGEINLSQVTFLQKTLREVTQQRPEQKPSKEITASLVEKMKNTSVHETQIMVSQALNLEIKESPKVIHQANESVRFEVTLSKEQWQKLQEMRELLSAARPGGQWDQVLEYVADKVIQQKAKAPFGKSPRGTPTNTTAEASLYFLKKTSPPKRQMLPIQRHKIGKNLWLKMEFRSGPHPTPLGRGSKHAQQSPGPLFKPQQGTLPPASKDKKNLKTPQINVQSSLIL
jgi:hypothetical protein